VGKPYRNLTARSRPRVHDGAMYRISILLVVLFGVVACAKLAEAEKPRPDPRFVDVVRRAAASYKKWGRVDEKPNIAPALCRAPTGDDFGAPSKVRTSAAGDGPHEDKLYFLWASARDAYRSLGRVDEPLPVGFAVVKQSFSSKPLVGAPPASAAPGPDASFNFGVIPPPITWLQTTDGKRLQIDQPRDLFVMAKVGERAGADAGWIYGTVAPDGTVTSAGRVERCMGCHESATHERLFGLRE